MVTKFVDSDLSIEDDLLTKDIVQEKFYKIQSEKNKFLGEYKERVIVAIKKDQLMRDLEFERVFEAIKSDTAFIMKMSRDVEIHKFMPYIKAAELAGLKYELVDALEFSGEVGLIVASREALPVEVDDPFIEDDEQVYLQAGLERDYPKNRGRRICKKCMERLEEVLPEKMSEFKPMNLRDMVLGKRCPVCKK